MGHGNRKRISNYDHFRPLQSPVRDNTSNNFFGKLLVWLWESISARDDDVFFFSKIGRLFIKRENIVLDVVEVTDISGKFSFVDLRIIEILEGKWPNPENDQKSPSLRMIDKIVAVKLQHRVNDWFFVLNLSKTRDWRQTYVNACL